MGCLQGAVSRMPPLLQTLVSQPLSPDLGQALAVPMPGLLSDTALFLPLTLFPVQSETACDFHHSQAQEVLSPMRFRVDVTSAFPMNVLLWFLNSPSSLPSHPPAPLSGPHPSLRDHPPCTTVRTSSASITCTFLHEGRSLSLRVLSLWYSHLVSCQVFYYNRKVR